MTTVLPVADIPLFGEHNLQNVLAAVAVARAAGVATSPIAGAVREFHAVPHRLQTVRDEDGMLWVNDSKATNVESAVAALRSLPGPDDRVDRRRQGRRHVDRAARRRGRRAGALRGAQRRERGRARRGAGASAASQPTVVAGARGRGASRQRDHSTRRRGAARARVQELRPVPSTSRIAAAPSARLVARIATHPVSNA